MLQETSIMKENMSREGLSMGPRREVGSTKPSLTQLTIGNITLQIKMDAVEFPMGELQEKVNTLGHLNIVISRIPMCKLQDL
jgi:hypothetical protein